MVFEPEKALALSPQFISLLGFFHGSFATFNLQVDWAIGHFLKLTPEQTHLIVAGLMFGPKGRILAELIGRSDHPKKAALLGALNKVRGNSKRDIVAHGYLWSSPTEVKFIERIASGEFKVRAHSFTLREFNDHVMEYSTAATEFYELLGVSAEEVGKFADAAFNLDRKAATSPDRPTATR